MIKSKVIKNSNIKIKFIILVYQFNFFFLHSEYDSVRINENFWAKMGVFTENLFILFFIDLDMCFPKIRE